MAPAPDVGPSAGQRRAGSSTGPQRPGAVADGSDVPAGAENGAPVAALPTSPRKRTRRPARRERAVSVSFGIDEYAAIVAASNRADLSPTAYVGVAALAAARGTEAPGSPVREALVELNQARTAAVRIGVACNKLAAKALAGAAVGPAELAAAAAAASRSVARVEAAAVLVHRRLA